MCLCVRMLALEWKGRAFCFLSVDVMIPAMIDDRSSSKCCLQDTISCVVDLTCSNAWKIRDFPKHVGKINGNVVFFFQISSKPSLIPVKFFGKWNRFVKMVNAILWRNLPVLKCSYRLPKAWTDRFAHVNDKQPRFGTMWREKSYTCDLWYKETADSRL